MTSRILIGIGGGTGAGKTSVAKNIREEVGKGKVVIIQQDAYYRDLAHIPLDERARANFDHPDAVDFDLLRRQMTELLNGNPIEAPIYDFSTHSRREEAGRIKPHPAIVVEGITVLFDGPLRKMMDIRIYVETDDDIRFIRRLTRDIKDRGRTYIDVIRQYLDTVKPMHEQFVEPTKKYADIIIPEGGDNRVAIDLIQTKIRSLLLS
ncbi:MAG: uridine kinase [Candidatus Neomarinimicrobiota bacterium]